MYNMQVGLYPFLFCHDFCRAEQKVVPKHIYTYSLTEGVALGYYYLSLSGFG